MKKHNLYKSLFFFLSIWGIISCHQTYEHKTVICIPVYGQSLALGEEAVRITDFDSLANYADGRIVTENMNHDFGYFEHDEIKKWTKKLIGYQKRAYELSVYTMAKTLADQTGKDTLFCVFPGGQGATALTNLKKGTMPYQEFMEDIETAYQEATVRGWDFYIPAVCWMQGESDIADYPDTDYRQLLTQIRQDMDSDIRRIIHQQDTVRFVCYQANSLSRAERFKAANYQCRETSVPMAFIQLLRESPLFWASGPTYPYSCVDEKIHIDAIGQQSIGKLAARSALGIIRNDKRLKGLIPLEVTNNNNDVFVRLNVPCPPLVLDTVQVSKPSHYGFSVITPDNRNIISSIKIQDDGVQIQCSENAQGCKVRYAVNGDYMKSGRLHGPRGNLRDSDDNWCYQFDIPIE